ncbi:signal-transduction and transcriptional-control protein [Clostridium pasteurianum DSM 525 = ATCC 6013]|uniref:Putative sigma54 specific transcriptional regulator with PAS/PAC sensor n=1 Tax=Clostridium pasteurianum DSM 525 = ATCC 6013 TaxID=1262449 RepID=A0A0H3J820_CLOPA|nr:sigma 54-interacting transcriptional regulator [Clostridium pasteurianum]AJA47155.1 signal-transduction and transcriptional-control protein [Clostridium pasteurianum DSM 525 = ATCC 6013]AJA51143.1 signal-transduction and transcriptional-control protein [Clostridium pasteurianum DSM 525 = ATCC 6013]AOZ74513.1 AAA family ATPase [Clostridium pasteurianum DSM 525 = ATCC 6013]AOZ78310.1 AAA family ATPase [Clostridium pasteurianum]ELP59458.1 sigma-54 dependent transcriptional regulator [Clostridi
MKNIAVITDSNSKLALFLKDNLEEIFKGFVNINNYYLSEMKEGFVIEDDLVLVMIEERIINIRNYVKEISRIMVVQRTIREKDVYKIFSIPEGMDVLVVNDNKETTLQTISLLYEIGINHLNFIPYYDKREYPNIKVAITPGEINKVPEYIEKIVDIGDRCIDFLTFMKIINRLEIDNDIIQNRLIKYSDTIINIASGIKEQYRELYSKNLEMKTVLNQLSEGIVLANKDGKITVCNNSALKMFDMMEGILNKNIYDVFRDDFKIVLQKKTLKDEVFRFGNRYLNINKRIINYLGMENGILINIREITEIKKLEQNLSSKLRERGQIARYSFKDILTQSSNMKECIRIAKKIADSDLTVLITGESGTGKELLAQSIHNESKRKNQPFIAVNCAAMPENLLESELFGYDRGAFTGALKEGKKGLFEAANNGTIFLDEIGDMPLHLQTRLLRILQEKQVMRIGSDKVIDIDIRVVAATNKNLHNLIEGGDFREDLYYRINVLPILIPPLRERKEDVMLLLKHFLKNKYEFSIEAKKIIEEYNWPGNIRELMNISSYINLMSSGKEVTEKSLPFYIINNSDDFSKEIDILDKKLGYDKYFYILKSIKKLNAENISAGRSNIIEELKKENLNFTEAQVRYSLKLMNDMNIIDSKLGRGGSKISKKGEKILNRIINGMHG